MNTEQWGESPVRTVLRELRAWAPRHACLDLDRVVMARNQVECHHGVPLEEITYPMSGLRLVPDTIPPFAPITYPRGAELPNYPACSVTFPTFDGTSAGFGQLRFDRKILGSRNTGDRIEILCDYGGRRAWYRT